MASLVAEEKDQIEALQTAVSDSRVKNERELDALLADNAKTLELIRPSMVKYDARRGKLMEALADLNLGRDKSGGAARKILDVAYSREIDRAGLRRIATRVDGGRTKRRKEIIKKLKKLPESDFLANINDIAIALRKKNANEKATKTLNDVVRGLGTASMDVPIVAIILGLIALIIVAIVIPIVKGNVRKALRNISEGMERLDITAAEAEAETMTARDLRGLALRDVARRLSVFMYKPRGSVRAMSRAQVGAPRTGRGPDLKIVAAAAAVILILGVLK